MRRLAGRFNAFGSPRIHQRLTQAGSAATHKRPERIDSEERLQRPRRRPTRAPCADGLGAALLKATRPHEVWGYDCLFTRTEYGDPMTCLTVVDACSKEALAIVADRTLTAEGVRQVLERIVARRGAPRFTRCDNGPEFTCHGLRRWLTGQGVTPIHIEPGCPWHNGFTESFNGKFREECLSQELCFSRPEAQVICEQYRRHDNEEKPPSSLAYKTPAECTAAFKG